MRATVQVMNSSEMQRAQRDGQATSPQPYSQPGGRFCFETNVGLAPSPNVPHKLHFRTGRPAIIPPSHRLTSTPAWTVRIPSWAALS